MTSAELKTYIDTYIRKNDKKEITGDQMNYILKKVVDYVDDEVGGVPTDHLGNSDLVSDSAIRKFGLQGTTSGSHLGIYDPTLSNLFFKVDATGLTRAEKGVEIRKPGDQNALKIYSGLANSAIHSIYNLAGQLIYEFREAGGAAVFYARNSAGAVNIDFNASSGVINAAGGYSVNGVTGWGANTGTVVNFGGGAPGEVASLTIAKGLITNVGLVP